VLKHHLKFAIRNLIRDKGYSLINIAGLAIGMAVCILILLWARYQFTYNKFHENIDELYWVATWYQLGDAVSPIMGSPPALAPALSDDYPEIVNATRYYRYSGLVKHEEKHFREAIKMVDPCFLEMFTFSLVKGDSQSALSQPYSLVITEKTAEKYFGDEDPVGKTLRVDNKCDFTVTGVAENLPSNSTLGFDFLAPISNAYELGGNAIDTWYNCSFYSMVQLSKGADYRAVSQKIKSRVKQSKEDSNLEPFLFPFSKIVLYSISGEGGYIETVKTFVLLALLILIIAIINFVNLMTARSGRRAKEVGVRKVVGATRGELARQFFGESIIYAIVAGIIAVLLVELFLPPFASLMGQSLSLDLFSAVTVSLVVISTAILTGILSGSYPALLLSSFTPARVLKGSDGSEKRRSWFRRILVVCQFAVSIVLIVSTAVIYRQHGHMEHKKLGFNRENLVYVPIHEKLQRNFETVKGQLLQDPYIFSVTKSTHSPSAVYWNGQNWDWEGRDPNTNPLVTYLGAGYDFLKTFGMEMAEGEFFSPEISGSRKDAVVINESFAKVMGFDSPVGKRLSHDGGDYTVLGVVRDFHFKPVRERVGPLVMYFEPEFPQWNLFLRIDPQHTEETLDYLGTVWNRVSPDYPFEYHFLEDDYKYLYYGEKVAGGILLYFAGLAIVISCMGLFGLACFMSERRTKEIGIRKVLGATVSCIVKLLSREFLILVLIANLIAAPVAYFLMKSWLQNYPYRVDLNAVLFVLVAALALVIATVTVSYQAVRAALANPVETLRYE
jgi:putative ABC transport system permease protein